MARPSGVVVLAVALGGAAGALLRWVVGEVAPPGDGIPWATFAVNVSGAAALAWLSALAVLDDRPLATAALGPGLLGGCTTLSACSEETRALLADGRPAVALAYLLGSSAVGVAAVAAVRRAGARRLGEAAR